VSPHGDGIRRASREWPVSYPIADYSLHVPPEPGVATEDPAGNIRSDISASEATTTETTVDATISIGPRFVVRLLLTIRRSRS